MARLGRSQPASAYIYAIPFSVTTSRPQQLWYAVYDTTTGALLSVGPELPTVSAGNDYAVIGRAPDATVVWSTTLRTFISAIPIVMIDRVLDLVADASLTSAWAAMSTDQRTAMRVRIGVMLGPFRWRFDFQDIDLQQGFGTQQ
jgi:hypothetical protein